MQIFDLRLLYEIALHNNFFFFLIRNLHFPFFRCIRKWGMLTWLKVFFLGFLTEDLFLFFLKNSFSEIFIFNIFLFCIFTCSLTNYSLRYKGPIQESGTKVWYNRRVRYKSPVQGSGTRRESGNNFEVNTALFKNYPLLKATTLKAIKGCH